MEITGRAVVQNIKAFKGENWAKDITLTLNLRRATVYSWEGNNSIPKAVDLLKIAKYLETTVEYLLTGAPPEGIPPEILKIAREIAALSSADREEIMLLVKHKLNREIGVHKVNEFPDVTEEAPAYGESIPFPNDVKILEWDIVLLPHYGLAAAGTPVEINIVPNQFIPCSASALKGPASQYYTVQIRGTSMVEAGILDGAYIILRRAHEPKNGKIMLVRHENESTLKRIRIKEKKVFLCWEDGSGKKIECNSSEYEIQGEYIDSFRGEK